MKRLLTLCAVTFLTGFSFAQIEGKWKTVDDVSGKTKSVVEIFKKSDGKYYGKVVKLYNVPADFKCTKCDGDRKNKPLLGLEVIRGLSKDGNEFDGGTIVDPKNGKVYKCMVERKGNKLDVRGYIGISLVGRTQTWLKAD